MDHVVYLDAKAKELEALIGGTKSMLIRGAAGRKLPHGRVNSGDILYFTQNNGSSEVSTCARVKSAFSSDKLSEEESNALLANNQDKLQLTEAQLTRWSGKRYLVLIEVESSRELPPFRIDRSNYGNMDDWLAVGDIESVKQK